jgi:hypothetical protein
MFVAFHPLARNERRLADANRRAAPTPWLCRKTMISFFCSAQASVMHLARTAPMAGHLAKPIRLGLDDVEDPLAEGLDHLLGVDRPDAPHRSGAEVFLDSVDRTWR